MGRMFLIDFKVEEKLALTQKYNSLDLFL